MATLNIKDPEVHRLAHLLARRRHTSATGAVRDALREALERDRVDRSGMAESLLAIAAEARLVHEDFRSDDDMYDDLGLPR